MKFMNLNPQESFFIVCSDETSENRNEYLINNMFKDIEKVVNKYGYDIQTYGTYDQAVKFFRNQKTINEIKLEME